MLGELEMSTFEERGRKVLCEQRPNKHVRAHVCEHEGRLPSFCSTYTVSAVSEDMRSRSSFLLMKQ